MGFVSERAIKHGGIMDQRSRRIPRENAGSPGETKDQNRSYSDVINEQTTGKCEA